eukprot:gb/GEZJ01001031.1/.p1 GENE.gb/GEZJ01001031.1/~~gb/GEZJ01001031.1/.p1  ORF type:complete len:1949 (-),score=230.99 gb/GEZJ01001031.1/:8653-14184(-)
MEVVRYSLKTDHPPAALEAARSVVRCIVRTYVHLITDVLVTDKRACARKALELLRLTALCHPLLAKEILNKYDLFSKRLASVLCSKGNNYCRMPFLDLLFSVITSCNRDVHLSLSLNARELFITCLSTITQRLVEEANATSPMELQSSSKAKNSPFEQKALPSYVQKRELVASVNFLLALHKHLFDEMPKHARRNTFAPPICNMLAKIACTELPRITVAPRQVQGDQQALRETAGKLFIAFTTDINGFMLKQAGDALLATDVVNGSPAATSFTLKVIEKQPLLSHHLLDFGPFLSTTPQPSTKWFSYCSILSASLMRMNTLPPSFSKRTFLEKCLSHSSSIVRHFGHLFTLSCCRIVLENDKYLEFPDMYLPSVDFLKQSLRKEKSGDALVQKLLAQYQLIFSRKADKRKTILMSAAVSKSIGSILEAEKSIRAGLRVAPNETVIMIMNHKLFSRLILQACTANDPHMSQRLWNLCAEVLSQSFLFPQNTKYEVELFLFVISGLGNEREICINTLENMISTAIANPYGLYDQLNMMLSLKDDASPPVSLFFVAVLLRIRKIKDGSKPMQGMSDSELEIFERTLVRIIEIILATMVALDPVTEKKFSLMSTVSSFVTADMFWWNSEGIADEMQGKGHFIKACAYLRELPLRLQSYPKTPLLALLSYLCLCVQQCSSSYKHEAVRSRSELEGIDLCWDTWQDFRSGELSWYHDRGFSDADLETAAVPRFFLKLCCTTEISGFTFEDQFKSLKCSLPKRDYIVLLSALFSTSSPQIREMLLPEVLGEVAQDCNLSSESRERLYCIGNALTTSVRVEEHWNQDSVGVIVSSCLNLLEVCGDDSHSRQKLAFCSTVLYNLTQHRYPSVSVCSYLLLDNVKHLNATFLPLLTVHCAKQLVDLIPYFPALVEALIEHIMTWDDGDRRPLPIPLLILVQGLLESRPSLLTSSIGEHKWKSCSLHVAMSLSTLPYCSSGRGESLKDPVVVHALRKLGEYFIVNLSLAKELAEGVKKHWDSSRTLSKFAWILWRNIFSPDRSVRLESVSREMIAELFRVFVDFIAHAPHALKELSILEVFSSILSYVRTRKCISFVGETDPKGTEGTLLSISMSLIRLAVNHKDRIYFGTPSPVAERFSSDHYELLCTCVSGILEFDMLVDEVARDSVILLCNEKHSIASLVGASSGDVPSFGIEAQVFHTPLSTQLRSTTNLLRVALNHLDQSSVSEEVLSSMLIIEEVFSCPSVYRASTSVTDGNIRGIMDRITHIRRISSQQQPPLQVRRGYFQVNAADVLPIFHKRLLEDACHLLLTPKAEAKRVNNTGDPGTALDPIFVLQLFLRGCGEALGRPSQPVVDINHIVREGLLDLALTGLASHEETTRSLAYACVELLSKLLGPIRQKVQGAAASLYKDRKQLAFLIELLRNSVTEPLTQCLSLFVVWFRMSLNVALKPRHPANKIVTTFFLRSPTVDIHDCLGLNHLLHCSARSDELLPVRSLALEILRKGVRTKKDVTVLKRRRVFNTIFMFGLRKSLFNSSLSFMALRTLSTLIERDFEVDVAYGLVSKHGIVHWIIQDILEGTERERQLVAKLEIVSKLARALRERRDTEHHMAMLSTALKHLGGAALRQSKHLPYALLRSLLECGAEVCDMKPELRRCIRFDFSAVFNSATFQDIDQNNSEVRSMMANLSKCIVRQFNVFISQETCRMILTKTILLFPSVTDENADNDVLERTMYHAFIAECFLNQNVRKHDAVIDSNAFELLAKILYMQPSIWILLAAYAALDSCDGLGDSLLGLSDFLPSAPPDVISIGMEPKYDSLVKDKKLVRTICSRLLSISQKWKNGDATCEPKSSSSSE